MEYEKVDPKDVRLGDECRVVGFGITEDHKGIQFLGNGWYRVLSLACGFCEEVRIDEPGSKYIRLYPNSIVEARRLKETPKVAVGSWRCSHGRVWLADQYVHLDGTPCSIGEVYRSTGSWHKDERKNTGPLVLRPGVEVTASGWGKALMPNPRLDMSVFFHPTHTYTVIRGLDAECWEIGANKERYDLHKRNIDPIERRKS